jgi:hypothetical protein
MNRDRLLADAKAKALSLVEGYQAPEPPTFRLPGAGGRAALDLAVQGSGRAGSPRLMMRLWRAVWPMC